jgi:N-acetylmuramoyl-L-alanine amidase
MPTLFLSPSNQEYNPYINSGNEKYYTNLIVDGMAPYLRAAGIHFARNNPETRVVGAVNASNSGDYDLHLAIHSNSAPDSLRGQLRGIDVYYYPDSVKGKRAAKIIAENLKRIYPYPDLVETIPTTQLYELNNTRAPAVMVELGYHDNMEDAEWITSNIERIAKNLAQSTTEYLQTPFVFQK